MFTINNVITMLLNSGCSLEATDPTLPYTMVCTHLNKIFLIRTFMTSSTKWFEQKCLCVYYIFRLHCHWTVMVLHHTSINWLCLTQGSQIVLVIKFQVISRSKMSFSRLYCNKFWHQKADTKGILNLQKYKT